MGTNDLGRRRRIMAPQVVSGERAKVVRGYLAHVQGIVASLSHEKALGRASELLRSLIETVTIIYHPEDQRHRFAIDGNLRALLELGGARDEPEDDPAGPGGSKSGQRSPRPSTNDRAPADGGGSGLSRAARPGPALSPSSVVSLQLVAGAGFEPAAFRL